MNSIYTHLVNIVYKVTGADQAIAADTKVRGATSAWDNKAAFAKELQGRGMAFDEIKKGAEGAAPAVENVTGKTNDFVKALNRAFIVAPVWMALRNAMQFVIVSLKDGFQAMIEFEKSIETAQQFVRGFHGDTAAMLDGLKDKFKSLAQETATPFSKVADAFSKFGAIGFNLQDSLRGAEAASKLAMATNGDAAEIANSLATAMKMLGNTVDQSIPAQERQYTVAAKMYEITKNNNISIGDLSNSLRTFASTANITGTSLDQVISLLGALNNAGVQGSKGGMALKTNFVKFLEGLPKIANDLGIKVVPEIEGTFNALLRVLQVVKRMSQENRLSEISAAFKDIFGGIRGSDAAKALVGVFDDLNRNIVLTSNSTSQINKVLSDFQQRQDIISKGADFQVDKFKIVKQIWMESFITGILGGENFAVALGKLNKNLEDTAKLAKDIGSSTRNMFEGGGPFGASLLTVMDAIIEKEDKHKKSIDVIRQAIKGQLDLETTLGLQQFIQNKLSDKELANRQNILRVLNDVIKAKQTGANAEGKSTTSDESSKLIDQRKNKYDDFANSITRTAEKQNILTNTFKAQQAGVSQTTILQNQLTASVAKLVNQYNNIKKVSTDLNQSISTQQILTLLSAGNYSEILKLTDNTVITQKEITELLKTQKDLTEAKIKDAESEKANALEIMKMRGATASELTRAAIALDKQIFGEDAVAKSTRTRFEMEKLITKEKLNQVEIGSDTLTLYKIAQKEGLQTASGVSQFITGGIDFKRLQEMPRALEAFKKYFSSRYEEIQAASFFGIPFGQGLGGGRNSGRPGSMIPIPEFEALKNIGKNATGLQRNSQVNIQGLSVTVTSDVKEKMTKEEKAKKITSDIADAIRTDPNVQKAIEDRIWEY